MDLMYVFVVIAALVVIVVAKTARVVPQQSAFVVERLGKLGLIRFRGQFS